MSDPDRAINELYEENEVLQNFIATIFCWKPEWTQTSYFMELPKPIRESLVELTIAKKIEGSGGMEQEWLDDLLTVKEKKNEEEI